MELTAEQELIEKFKEVIELTEEDQGKLFALMDAFQQSAQETIIGGEELFKMCDGCAFKKGTEANKHPYTVLTATECVLRDEPFYCHKRFCPNGSEKICNGWINIMNNK